jgi:rhodanese-related sulfurtransferase
MVFKVRFEQELKKELTEIYKNLNLVELRRRQRELIEKLMRLKEKKNSKIIVYCYLSEHMFLI